MSGKNKTRCQICGEPNADILGDHLLVSSFEEAKTSPWSEPPSMVLCVNCHRIVHRSYWTPLCDKSYLILAKYFYLLQSLPRILSVKLRSDLMAARDRVEKDNNVEPSLKTPDKERACVLCKCANGDLIEEHIVRAKHERPNSVADDIVADVCANCHRVLLRFYDGKDLLLTTESKLLLRTYLQTYNEYLPLKTKNGLIHLSKP